METKVVIAQTDQQEQQAKQMKHVVQYSGRTRLARVWSACHDGVKGYLCQVEVCLMQGLPIFDIVGSADAALRGASQRLKPALRMSGFVYPDTRIVVNISPAWLPKRGTSFDLPIAMGILLASGQLKTSLDVAAFGELGLDGDVQPVPGAYVLAQTLLGEGATTCFIPPGNRQEILQWLGQGTRSCAHLSELPSLLTQGSVDEDTLESVPGPPLFVPEDFSMIQGQALAIEAMKIAAAGGHHILLMGSPGCGKTSLARCLPGILPDLSPVDQAEVASIYSITGHLLGDQPDLTRPPFRTPHFSTSRTSLFGGGVYPMPGEVTLAHLGVLFLDEINRFASQTLAQLLEPLEEGRIRVTRLKQTVVFPSRFMLIAAANPCPCGHQLDGNCRCPEGEIKRYRRKLIAPFLDRIDIQVGMQRLKNNTLHETITRPQGPMNLKLREQVIMARALQYERHRQAGYPDCLNSNLPASVMQEVWGIDEDLLRYSERVADHLHLSVRAYQKVWRVARSISDLQGAASMSREAIDLAIHFRSQDKEGR